MTKARSIYTVDFCRDNASPSMEIELMKGNETISLDRHSIAYCSKVLSQKEIKTIIEILETKKELMLKECDFPKVYDEMLNDLIIAYKERYGKQVKKEDEHKIHDSLSITELEEILRHHYKLKEVRVDSIYAGSDSYNTMKIEVGFPKGFLVLSFSGVEEND